ncbi:MAG: hypothetical protein MK165_15485 [Pirellulaceae bacterium]|nr:hypothetical protein [Pirellulaceae bacterium]
MAVRLKDKMQGCAIAYLGFEHLPDNTFVMTIYGYWKQREAPYVLSVRFTLNKLDAVAKL